MLRLLARAEELAGQGKLHVVLGSKSPRRSELLRENVLGGRVPVSVVPSAFKEDYDKSLYVGRAHDYVKEYAVEKAKDVEAQVLAAGGREGLVLVIGCDTVVVKDGAIFEKPETRDEAVQTLAGFSGSTHAVVSGLTVVLLELAGATSTESRVVSRESAELCCETRVRFAALSPDTIQAYVDSGEPMDKAGGYGIQGLGAALVAGVDGCYFNVVGLPVFELSRVMGDLLAPRLGM